MARFLAMFLPERSGFGLNELLDVIAVPFQQANLHLCL